jgi:hypothetical protein
MIRTSGRPEIAWIRRASIPESMDPGEHGFGDRGPAEYDFEASSKAAAWSPVRRSQNPLNLVAANEDQVHGC